MSIGIGVIGAGVMGADHARIIREEISGAHLAMVADQDVGRAEAAAKGARTTTDPSALVYDHSVGAVLIASPDDTHFGLLKAALAAGKPVLCEKPLATKSEEALEIVRLEKRLGRSLVQTGYMRRFDPSYRAMKTTLAGGELGRARMLHCSHRNASAPPWFVGAMPVTNTLVHEIDICRWLLNDELIAVSAIPTKEKDPALFVFETAGGTVISVEVFMNATYGYHVQAEAVCSNGTVSLAEPTTQRLRINGSEQTSYPQNWIPRFADAYRIQNQKWVAAIANGTVAEGAATSWDGFAATFIAEQVLVALETRQRVEIKLPVA
ncbi:gfo/Idh/MocA family oxidoreductase (plasmid) [Rhizobium grahamii]|uniref:Gfo/Idh/MocA family oxidoreductase n=1 Tax=Rhizobium grahamii TaxID=1120045 RepID=A0A5Q0CH35_9HYPH|nr:MULTISPECIES: Gfo/Idh/MocA family oxidoreductase [Rhizobium]QFY63517.1 gfo/Idh/MocA family oxidoreductase [Rhizobium grahamii]QRM51720.1 gfo/Idh/MocA family oxidoreductase [Rhizobium sp. BG6]